MAIFRAALVGNHAMLQRGSQPGFICYFFFSPSYFAGFDHDRCDLGLKSRNLCGLPRQPAGPEFPAKTPPKSNQAGPESQAKITGKNFEPASRSGRNFERSGPGGYRGRLLGPLVEPNFQANFLAGGLISAV
jgi:hypothetical protein